VSGNFDDTIRSAPGVKVTMRFCDLYGAETAVRSGEAIAAIYIPENLERDIRRGRRPHVAVFLNKQFFSSPQYDSNSIRAAASAAADLEASPHSRAYNLGPVIVE
jgi:ABC-2 type transport system permease protein